MRRILGISFGLLAQAALIATLWPLFRFLRNDLSHAPEGSLWIDAAAALQFSVVHSLLLFPPTRRWITTRLRSEFYGSLFCLATCVGLWIVFGLWRGSRTVVWAWPESWQSAVQAGFFLSWGTLFYSLNLTGLGYQTGFTPWWHWIRGKPLPRREFHPIGAYRLLRHPAYLSFLGLVWLTPVVTADRAVLIAVWTTYVFIGSALKDQRLARLLGEPYRQYMAAVPAYPFPGWRLLPGRIAEGRAIESPGAESAQAALLPLPTSLERPLRKSA